ncbi:MAG TPA: gluconate 2-dehydrogenase subunit 3 family protein [Candidatus Acidoferrum sp.]|nr:gluconate 2-dehydrogenase subunit 3 family protein [Candidatus Acidoferrum sp.]
MSPKNPIDLRQDRREWLKTSAVAFGATLLPLPAVTGEQPQAATPPAKPAATAARSKPRGRFFTAAQHALVEELSEAIIPADSHSGGAKAAKVADFIDEFLGETYDENQRALWREGLRLVDLMSGHYCSKSFVEATPEERIAALKVLSDNDHMTDLAEVRFYLELKRLTVRGYYTSKIGIHDELEYKGNRILQEYVGCDDQGASKS